MDLQPGLQINENLTLLRELGKGGMGAVWVAHHKALDTEVAVKFILGEHDELSDALLSRFRREARAAAKLKSPHVVQMFDHGETSDGSPYIVMELLAGESLRDRLRSDEKLSPRDVLRLIEQVTSVLSEAHEAGIIHRDIKPDNLFLVEGGRGLFAKILDFGLAKNEGLTDVSVVTATTSMAGTPYFMSPEQLVSTKNVDSRTDLWALSVVAYLALSGTRPFKGDSLPALTLVVFDGKFTPVSELVPELGEALDAWFARAFHNEIEERFQTADELHETFAAALDGVVLPSSRSSLSASSIPSTETTSSPAETASTATGGETPSVSLRQPSGAELQEGTLEGATRSSPDAHATSSGRSRWPLAAAALALVVGGVWWKVSGSGGGPADPAVGSAGVDKAAALGPPPTAHAPASPAPASSAPASSAPASSAPATSAIASVATASAAAAPRAAPLATAPGPAGAAPSGPTTPTTNRAKTPASSAPTKSQSGGLYDHRD